jgi:two-component system, OmpR family, heavy metal sensor histidine kinase CusS
MSAVGRPGVLARWRAALRCSMTAQIGLSITLVATVLVAGSSLLVLQLSRKELGDVADVVLLAHLVNLRHALEAGGQPLPVLAERWVQRSVQQLGSLQAALLDDQGRVLAVSAGFALPLDPLPALPLAASLLPDRVTPEQVRRLQQRQGTLARDWKVGDGRVFRYIVGRLAGAGAAPGGGLQVVLALDAAPARDLTRRSGAVIALALLLSLLTAAALGMGIARRIAVAARELGRTASSIGDRAQGERLDVQALPHELRDTGQAFNRMLDRLEAAFERQSQFASDLAHDLRTPLNNLLGEAQVALSRPRAPDEYRSVLVSAVEDYERLQRLIENMLLLARADDSSAVLQCEWLNLQDLGNRLRDYFDTLAEERGVHLVLEWRGERVSQGQLWADRTMVARAIGNLLSNALRYAPAGSTVALVLGSERSGAVQVEVSNSGPPIAAVYQQKIFERLFRIDPAREGSAQGAGLGLAIVRSIMTVHGGTATVRSGDGPLTVFTLRFPPPPPPAPRTVGAPVVAVRPG